LGGNAVNNLEDLLINLRNTLEMRGHFLGAGYGRWESW
jgi:hypothetical protein